MVRKGKLNILGKFVRKIRRKKIDKLGNFVGKIGILRQIRKIVANLGNFFPNESYIMRI